ncbi:basic amino acid ABC transporter substrate-binding protein [Selenomonas sp. TAMA-11512]|uniref:basic amino acid ABC transporter substrate-binding protein n=1 Tax=Selenomonas sp. TAMA-11512 TaxID=3095337 RepID=UPI00308D3CF7|nr:basic amino acid ABC transporter substrate-binding protein [Selenomonas sp. TAMA-11512]
MKMKKTFLMGAIALMTAASFVVTGCGGSAGKDDAKKASEPLKVATNADFAPFEFQEADGREYQGFDMDLIRAVAKEMGREADIQNMNFDALIPALATKNIDLTISGMTINEERKKNVLFSDPYYQSGLTIVVKKGNEDIKSFADLAGKNVAVQIGTTSANEVKKNPAIHVKEFNSSADTFLELKAGGVDAVVNDRPVNDYYIQKSGETDVKTLDEILTAEEYGIAMAKDNEALQKEVNAALKKLRENGEYDKIYEKWFGKASK